MTPSAATASLHLQPPEPIELRGVNVVDTRTGKISARQDVGIADGRIVSMANTGASPPLDGTTRIDVHGKFLVPGFIDMHVHALNSADPSDALALMLANGITGFRQMSGTTKLLADRKAGALKLPEASPALLALCGDLLSPVNAATPETAAAAVSAQMSRGADFIKIAAVGVEQFSAAQAEAQRLGIPLAGHLPVGIDPVVASKSGIHSIEHLGPGIVMIAACSTDEDTIRTQLNATPEIALPNVKLPFMDGVFEAILKRIVINPVRRTTPESARLLQHAIDTFSLEKARALAEAFIENQTWQCLTLIRQLTSEQADLPRFRSDPNLRYVSNAAQRNWRKATDDYAKLPPETRSTLKQEYELQLRLAKLFDDAGVKMTAGTDSTGAGWVIPGFALHAEFDELASAGFTPLRVLQLATLNGAEFLDATDSLGTVAVGKLADLVLLDANPLESVQNLHTISGVIRGGRYYSSGDLDSLKRRVEASRNIE
jgi:imidazolonepropionase-like amidohydrolase